MPSLNTVGENGSHYSELPGFWSSFQLILRHAKLLCLELIFTWGKGEKKGKGGSGKKNKKDKKQKSKAKKKGKASKKDIHQT